MAGNYRFAMDQKGIVRTLITTVGSFTQDRLIDKEQRVQHKEQCAERLAAEDGSSGNDTEVRYSDQAVLANLDWGIDALEEAINTSNIETKHARLDYAEKMLHVCAMLTSDQKTAGVPNPYLSAWAYLNLSYLWELRNNVHNSVLHVLEMFIVEPFFSRIDFAPELWKKLFLPHMSSIAGWYAEARHRLMMEVVPDSSDMSFTADLDQFFNESLVFSMRPDQMEKLKKLEQLYSESLDENTRLFAKYYKDCMNSDSSSGAGKKVMAPMLPIAEPPMTPLHEVSRSIPNYVKFGPILPKSAGFSPVLKSKHGGREGNNRVSLNSSAFLHDMDESAAWDPRGGVPEGNEDDSDYEANDGSIGSSVQQQTKINRTRSPLIFSPVDSPRTSSSKTSSPKSDVNTRKESGSLLRLLSCRIAAPSDAISLPISPSKSSHSISSADSDGEVIETPKSCRKNGGRPSSTSYDYVNIKTSENSFQNESDEGSLSCVSLPLSEKLTPHSKALKDFVCPITGQIFNDPVTLETGQTYERKAIEEWLNRGNTTCPITRQRLSSNVLPKTNYVLKRLITAWKEQHPDLAQELLYSETPKARFSSPLGKEIVLVSPSNQTSEFSNFKAIDDHVTQRGKRFTRPVVATSPTSVISQAAVETIINELRSFVSCLCTSNNLQECESAVLEIARLWKDSKGDAAVHSYLSKPTIVNGFMEILSASLDREVLRASIYILCELIFGDESIGETLTSVDSDFDCLAALLKNGLAEAAVLMYQLRPAFTQLSSHDLVHSLMQIILCKSEESDDLLFMIKPKDAAIAMLEQILMSGDENSRSLNALTIVSLNGIASLVKCLHRMEGRRSIISILLCCTRVDKSCKNVIANGIELLYVLELFHTGNDSIRGICVDFLSELVQLNRRTLSNQMLQIIKTEGAFSTMHTFLVYLQMAPMEHQPATATLLLQLDLLVEPRKMSIYREEAIEALIEALRKKEFPNQQMMVLDALLSLPGRITSSGESYIESWLLKVAGFDHPYNALVKADWTETKEEEEKAVCSWEKRVAFVLCNHEKGCIFKALEEIFKNNSLKMTKSCLVIATWLTYMLSILPDTGVREAARESLLDEFINVLQSSKNLEEKILAVLALKTFINDPTAIEELGKYAKCIYKTLRKLKRNSFVATDILKALMNLSSVNATEMWSCTDVVELDLRANGEVLCMVYLKGCLISSHSDGTIKVWDAGRRRLRLVQEAHEHIKAVTCLYVPSSGDRLYSGSLDKTIRVWELKPEEIQCIQVHDVKEAVHELAANAKFACFISQGNGVKVYNWSGTPKHINFNKSVKCLAMTGNKLYCGCSGYNIQELDLCSGTVNTFHLGTRKLLGKQTVNSLNIHDDLLFAGGSAVDGISGKVFCRSSKAVMGTFPTGFDIQRIAVNNDFIFTATKLGIIEVWLKERVSRVGSIKMKGKGHAKITSLVPDIDAGMLYAASSDGKIQVWALD
ncbi:putative E3 ubiquitin-protein ligase LIN-1 [Hibiscus syriacus]|uniref:putative E3 ubiquitin-protein ligase LIN-1 n=1 Tax=Hibiscus syriacus TaxID=106335 RepID=UPI00192061AB|nr:putative E3 ubiquitin-protein ligase LIN-1 [Hibiscus syriacus]